MKLKVLAIYFLGVAVRSTFTSEVQLLPKFPIFPMSLMTTLPNLKMLYTVCAVGGYLQYYIILSLDPSNVQTFSPVFSNQDSQSPLQILRWIAFSINCYKVYSKWSFCLTACVYSVCILTAFLIYLSFSYRSHWDFLVVIGQISFVVIVCQWGRRAAQ